jgi:hypothetical protein
LVTATLTLGLSERTGPLRDLTLYGAANQTPTRRATRVPIHGYRDGIARSCAEGGWSLCCLIADQAVSKESNEVASHYLKHAGYLKEDVVGGIVLVRVQGIIKLLRATHEEEDILIGVRVATMQKP